MGAWTTDTRPLGRTLGCSLIIFNSLSCWRWRLDKIITCDEMWVHHITHDSKRASMTWKHLTFTQVKKFRQMLFLKKVLVSIYGDGCSVLLTEFIYYGQTMNKDAYCEHVRKLQWIIQNRRLSLLTCIPVCAFFLIINTSVRTFFLFTIIWLRLLHMCSKTHIW